MLPKRSCIKKTSLLFPLILLSVFLHAQVDTLPKIMQEIAIDTAEKIITEITDDEDSDEETVPAGNIYFLQKNLQANGGGPDSVHWKKLPDSVLIKLQASEDFWYVNYVFDPKKKVKQNKDYERREKNIPFLKTSFFQTLLWILIIGGFATFVIIYLANSNTGLFRKKNTVIRSDEEMETATNNIFEINYQREIDKAVSNGNYRFAVRLMFLRVLKNLSDKNAIQYTPDRTNFDYLLQLQPTPHYTDFFKLTRNYEYSWYGHFDVDADKFSWIRKDFENFDHKLK